MKNIEVMRAILEKIKEYDRIIIFRHLRPDGDAVGSTKGLQAILKLTFPEKEIYLQNSDYCDYMKFLGPEDEPIADELYADALGIVVDTGTLDRISNKKYELCRELVKIDHHIRTATTRPREITASTMPRISSIAGILYILQNLLTRRIRAHTLTEILYHTR